MYTNDDHHKDENGRRRLQFLPNENNDSVPSNKMTDGIISTMSKIFRCHLLKPYLKRLADEEFYLTYFNIGFKMDIEHKHYEIAIS